MHLTTEFQPIRNWAAERGIYDKGDIKTQYIKLQEEMGELAQAILKEDSKAMEDAVGDCVVVLTNLTKLMNQHFGYPITIEDCINYAFKEIQNRKGEMKNGTFVKR